MLIRQLKRRKSLPEKDLDCIAGAVRDILKEK
jgi:hypothetical protein